ncbi:DUF4148 domain-containing protein [Rhodoferax sp.]|uniref:DUF4148 domain-containing protein n=1 Tax=Rhodoferax sp. TaxID=50421 RepID=UPI0025DD1E12|nr:DUF4148 domain-containing protein [Rhodoferax sp.]
MNTTKFVAASMIALASVAATSAFADSYDREYSQVASSPSTVTRAQVKAELLAAQKDGSLAAVNDNDYPVITATGSAKTRAQVRAELIQAEKDGTMPVVHG